MIPLHVQLKNFLSYGAELQTINFIDHHLICFTGKNGHGKSALLDAITWALWGQARKVTGTPKADEGLVRLGAKEMLVILDFTCSGTTYRVRREYVLGKSKSQQYLEFGIVDPQTNTLKPLTDKTIRATQAGINRAIGLDYETFTNSAFIRQGQSNEFSTKTPKERKEILGTILGLERFEKIRKLVQEEQRAATAKIDSLKSAHERYETELAKESDLEKDLHNLQELIAGITQQEASLHTHQQELSLSKEKIIEEHQELKIIALQHDHIKKEYEEKRKDLQVLVTTWRDVHKKNIHSKFNNSLPEHKAALEKQIADLQEQQKQYLVYKNTLLDLKQKERDLVQHCEQKIMSQLHTLDIQHSKVMSEQQATEQNIKKIRAEQSSIDVQLKALSQSCEPITQELLEKAQQLLERKQACAARLTARLNGLEKDLAHAQEKNSLVADNAACPLCEQSLQEEHKANLYHKLRDDINRAERQRAKISKALFQAPNLIALQKAELLRLTKQCEDAKKQKQLLEQFAKYEEQARELSTTLAACALQFNEISKNREHLEKEKTLWRETNDTYISLCKGIRETSLALERATVDGTMLEKAEKELATIQAEIARQQTLMHELQNQPARKAAIHGLCNKLRELTKLQAPLEKKLVRIPQVKDEAATLAAKLQLLEQEEKKLTQEKAQLLEKRGRLMQQQEQLMQIKKETVNLKNDFSETEGFHRDLNAISMALSKDGIQALLIEEALPEIEGEANRLLAKLTDNTQQIFIESLRDLKSGGTKETLDIKISDTSGIRPYELFSGGEAFRIDFALRIAISKLLAHRAGAALQTLIIDEGFGSQDDEGLSRIMDALHKIQDDFAKIIIVSHLPTMQHQFPSQFYINKGPSGSHVTVIAQG